MASRVWLSADVQSGQRTRDLYARGTSIRVNALRLYETAKQKTVRCTCPSPFDRPGLRPIIRLWRRQCRVRLDWFCHWHDGWRNVPRFARWFTGTRLDT